MSRHDRTLSPEQQALKRAAKKLIGSVGGVEAACKFSHRSTSQISSYGNPNTGDFMPADVIASLEQVSHGGDDAPAMTRHLAREAGFVLIKLAVADDAREDWLEHIRELADEPAKLIRKISLALGDKKSPGEITPAEIKAGGLRALVHEAQEQLAELDASLADAEAK